VYGGAGVARIDPSTNAVGSTVPVGVHPQKMIVVGAALWLVEDGENDIVVVPQP
jgi:DNA-binding beta-propeller fold protein YncE